MKQTLPSLTIGIPAHNEAQNIAHLLESLLSQTSKEYQLKKLVVVCDACTDNTVEVVKTFQKRNKLIQVVERFERGGKVSALNVIYDQTLTDYLAVFDADVITKNTKVLDLLVRHMRKNPEVVFCGPRHQPVKTNTFWGRCAEVSYLSLEEAFLKLRKGNNMYAVLSCYMMRNSWLSTWRYPKGVMADQCYLFAKAMSEHSKGFQLVKNVVVLFRPVSTFYDWRLLALRSVSGDRNDVVKYFGQQIVADNQLSKLSLMIALLHWLLVDPIHTVGSTVLNLFIRIFPLKSNLPKNGIWEPSQSSKIGIV